MSKSVNTVRLLVATSNEQAACALLTYLTGEYGFHPDNLSICYLPHNETWAIYDESPFSGVAWKQALQAAKHASQHFLAGYAALEADIKETL